MISTSTVLTNCLISVSVVIAYSQTTSPSWPTRPSNTIVWLGDSITAFGDEIQTTGSQSYSWGWTAQAVFLSDGRLQQLFNAGIPGNTCEQVLARFQTDVAPYVPSKVSLACGTNDLPQSPFTASQLTTEKNTYQSLITSAIQ